MDPEGHTRAETGPGPEEVLTDTLDLAEARRVRARGTAGLTRVWDPFEEDRPPLELPLYAGRIDPERWRRGARQ